MAAKGNKQGATGKSGNNIKDKKKDSNSTRSGEVKTDSSQGHGKSTAKNVKRNLDTEQE
jgi:hypothetical protein